MRVGIVDDSALFREGMRLLLESVGVSLCLQAREPVQLLQELETTDCDAVILDVRMPPTFTEEGLDLVDELRARKPGLPVLVLSAYAEPSYAFRLLEGDERGIGLLSKDRVSDVGTLVDTLERLRDGGTVIDHEIIARMVAASPERRAMSALTERERTVIELMAEGLSNPGIAERLNMPLGTVGSVVTQILTKLDVPSDATGNRRVLQCSGGCERVD